MREILFRGKRCDNGEWVIGNLFIPDKPDTPTQICVGTNIIRITYDVIPETIGQYTGLTDKNGNKLFEGDIIQGFMDFGPAGYSPQITAIYWDDVEGYRWNYFLLDTIEIISNIHDNPEILKGVTK